MLCGPMWRGTTPGNSSSHASTSYSTSCAYLISSAYGSSYPSASFYFNSTAHLSAYGSSYPSAGFYFNSTAHLSTYKISYSGTHSGSSIKSYYIRTIFHVLPTK